MRGFGAEPIVSGDYFNHRKVSEPDIKTGPARAD
jgi:hypothetical protein